MKSRTYQSTEQKQGPVQLLNLSSPASSVPSAKPTGIKSAYMKRKVKRIKHAAFILIAASCLYACSPKYGCPSNGKNVGAEKILSGEKLPKAKKFKA